MGEGVLDTAGAGLGVAPVLFATAGFEASFASPCPARCGPCRAGPSQKVPPTASTTAVMLRPTFNHMLLRLCFHHALARPGREVTASPRSGRSTGGAR